MKYTDEAWARCRDYCGLTDADRARVEQDNTDWHAKFFAKAKGNELLGVGLMSLAIAKDMAADFGMPEEFILKTLIDKSPNPARMKKAIRLARKGH